MSNKTARIHSHVSNRAKPRQSEDRKVVFKSVLDNPFRVQWPSVPINVQNSLLALSATMLDGIAEYQSSRSKETKKRKQERHMELGRKKRKNVENVDAAPIMELDKPDSPDIPTAPSSTSQVLDIEQPAVLKHTVIGINEVTRRLEAQIRGCRPSVQISTVESPRELTPQPALKTIFVCYADINPPLLVDHLPHLVAAYNTAQSHNTVKLVPLPKGAEAILATATGLRRAAVIAIDTDLPEEPNLTNLLDSVPTLAAPWLSNVGARPQLIPTHIKQIRTSAPKNMKAAKEQRSEGKALAKQRRKQAETPL